MNEERDTREEEKKKEKRFDSMVGGLEAISESIESHKEIVDELADMVSEDLLPALGELITTVQDLKQSNLMLMDAIHKDMKSRGPINLDVGKLLTNKGR